jgi:uncharacterized protein YecE (DUF72 family)
MTGRLAVGCSGWSYPDWRGAVSPADLPKTRWFEHYATIFDTVELNNTFYRLPNEAKVAKWAESAPPGFVFSVKLGAFGSHRMKLRDPERWLARHVSVFGALGDHLGPTLVQLPPRWRRDVDRLDAFLRAAPRSMRWAVEVRDPSWLHPSTYAVLRRHAAALCIHDLVANHPVEMTASWTYIRFHGPEAVEHPYRGRYGAERLTPWSERINVWLRARSDVYAYFNNDYEGHAVADATTLRQLVEERAASSPRQGRK